MALTTGLQLPYGIQPVNPIPVDSWSGPYEGLTESIAKDAANAAIPSSVRFKSMEVRLIIDGSPKKYWYAAGILDSDLVEFFSFELADLRYFPLTGGTIDGNTKIRGNLTVYGDISSTGDSYFANTIYSTTSALSVINVGNTGPAIYVANNGSGDLASFYDLDTNIEMLHIGGANGSFPNIGVKTSTPNKDLTVNGEISAYGSIWTSGDFISGGREIFSIIYPDINKGLDVYSNVKSNSATYATYNYVDSNFLNLTGGIIDGNLSVLSSFEVGSGDTVLFVSGGKVGINTETPNAELTVNGTISANAIIYDLLGNSQQWNSVYTAVSAASATWGGTLTTPVTSDLNVGAITAGQKFDIGTTFQFFVEKLITTVFFPTFTAPSATLTSNLASSVESGTTGIALTVNLNRGSITGKSVGGIWQPSTFQDNRSGNATKYTIFDIDNGTTTTYTSANAVVNDGTNTFTATVDYATGPQPLDSKNNNFNSPLPAGSISPTLNIAGRRKAFYGINSAGSSSTEIRNLTHLLNPQNNTSFTISLPIGTTSIVFAYPASLRDVTSVKESVLNSDIKGAFGTPYNVDVSGNNGYTAIPYKVYRFQPPNPIATANYSYTVTI